MLFLDGSISQIFSTHLFRPSAIMVSHLVVLWLIAAVLFEDQYDIPIARWAAAAGAIFDLYYTGIFGVLRLYFSVSGLPDPVDGGVYQSELFEWAPDLLYRYHHGRSVGVFSESHGAFDQHGGEYLFGDDPRANVSLKFSAICGVIFPHSLGVQLVK
jgi:rod shape-determining protein MreD.